MSALALAFGVVFLAELGDKSQLIALSLAARRPALQVLAGLTGAALVLQGLSAALGAALSAAVPMRAVAVVAGAAFLVAAAMVLRSSDEPAALDAPRRHGSTVLLAFGSLLLAELADKTMIATAALAAREDAVLVWLGGTAGFVAADALAVLLGARLLQRLPVPAVRRGTAVALAALGVVLLVGAF